MISKVRSQASLHKRKKLTIPARVEQAQITGRDRATQTSVLLDLKPPRDEVLIKAMVIHTGVAQS